MKFRDFLSMQNLQDYFIKFSKNKMGVDAILVFAVQNLTVLMGFATGIIFARCLSIADLGKYQLCMSFINLGGQILTLPGLSLIIMKGAAKNYDRIYYKAIKQSLISGLMFSALLLGAYAICKHWNIGSELYRIIMIWTAVSLPVMAMDKYDSLLNGKREFKLSRSIAFFSGLTNFIGVGATAFYTRSFPAVLAASFVSHLVTSAIALRITHKKVRCAAENKPFETELFRLGWQQSFVSVFSILVSQLDKITLGLIDPKLLAVYYIGNNLPYKVKDNIKVMLGVPTAHWASLSREENYSKIKKHGIKVFMIGLGLTLFIVCLSPFFIPFFYGKQYSSSVWVCQLVSLPLGINFLSNVILSADFFQNKGRYANKTIIARQVIYSVLLFALVGKFKIAGIVTSFLIAEFSIGIWNVCYMRKEIHRTANSGAAVCGKEIEAT